MNKQWDRALWSKGNRAADILTFSNHPANELCYFSVQDFSRVKKFSGRTSDIEQYVKKWSRSVMSDSLWPHRLQPTGLLSPWNFPGKSTGVGCHFLLQGSSQPRDRTRVSRTTGRCFTAWATREAHRAVYTYTIYWHWFKNKTVTNNRPTVSRSSQVFWVSLTYFYMIQTLILQRLLSLHFSCSVMCPILCESMGYSTPGFPVLH